MARSEVTKDTPNKGRSHKKIILLSTASGLFLICLVVIASFLFVKSYDKYIVADLSENKADIGIVFGSGVSPNGKPFKELQARLDDAAEQIQNGSLDKLILSGDNRVENYNEPVAMYNYMVEIGVDEKHLQPDFAGRSTYETCERASKIFGVEKAVLFSANSHLARAIFTCRSFGIESYGIGNDTEADNSTRRELLANVKAMFNVYIYGEKTILGDPVDLSTEYVPTN